MKRLATLAAFTALAGAQVVDRVAVVVDREAITLGRIVIDTRLAAFQDGREVDTAPEARRKTAERMVDRVLLLREVAISGFLPAQRVDADKALDEIKKRWTNAADYRAALLRYRITEDELLDYLQSQLTVLRFLDSRFKPEGDVSDADVERYYNETFLPKWKATGKGDAPAIAAVRREIEAVLQTEAGDRAISRWLENTRAQSRIAFREEAFVDEVTR